MVDRDFFDTSNLLYFTLGQHALASDNIKMEFRIQLALHPSVDFNVINRQFFYCVFLTVKYTYTLACPHVKYTDCVCVFIVRLYRSTCPLHQWRIYGGGRLSLIHI